LNKGSFQLVDSGSKYSLKWACYSEEIVEYAQKIDKTKAYSTVDDSNRYPSCDELCLRDVNCILYVKEFPLFEETTNRFRFNIQVASRNLASLTVVKSNGIKNSRFDSSNQASLERPPFAPGRARSRANPDIKLEKFLA